MSKNAVNKRRAKARHRDQWSLAPLGTPFEHFVHGVVPVRTPLMSAMMAQKSRELREDMWRLFREKYANG